MAYATTNPPILVSQGIGGAGREWTYASTDALATVRVSGYFTNGYDLGMRAGDKITIIDTDATPIDLAVAVVASATTSAVDITDGTELAGADTD
jgi:hypothetical protein